MAQHLSPRLPLGPAVVLAALASACSGAPAASFEPGSAVGARVLAIAGPAEPAAPAPPVLTPCPAGWQASGERCLPWPRDAGAPCDPGLARFPGQAECQPVGSACPGGDWPEGLPTTGTVLFVKSGAAGDAGTQAEPFGTIAEAMAASRPGTVIALAKGTFDEPVRLAAGVTLWGACPEASLLTSSLASTSAGVVTVTGSGAVVRNLRLGGGRRPGLMANGAGLSVHLQQVEISGAQRMGLGVLGGASVTADTLVVRKTQPDGATQNLGVGVYVSGGSSLDVARGVFEGNRAFGVLASGAGASVLLDRSAVVDTRSSAQTGALGHGVSATNTARVELRATALERNQGAGASASGGTVVVSDSLVVDTRLTAGGEGGVGLFAEGGGRLEGHRVAVLESLYAGIRAEGAGTAITVQDAVVVSTRLGAGGGGFGLEAQGGATVKAARVRVEDAVGAGVFSLGAGTLLELEDAVIQRVVSDPTTGEGGFGVCLDQGGAMVLARTVVEDVQGAGLLAVHAGTVLRASDVVVRRVTHATYSEVEAGGVLAQAGARIELSRGLLEANEIVAVGAMDPGTRIVAEDLHVVGTLSTARTGLAGYGLGVQAGARLEATRALIEDCRSHGAVVQDVGSELVLSDIALRGTRPPRCMDTGGCQSFGGAGFSSVGKGWLELRRFSSEANQLVGVAQASGGTVDLAEGLIAHNPIGLNLEDATLEGLRIDDATLLFFDNQVKVGGQVLPLPDFSLSHAGH